MHMFGGNLFDSGITTTRNPIKSLIFYRSKFNFGGHALVAKLPLPDLQNICMY